MDSAKLKYLAEAQPKQRRRVEISESVYEFQTDQAGGHGSHQGRNDGLSSTYSYSLGRSSEVVAVVKDLTHDRSPIQCSHEQPEPGQR